MAKAVKPVKRKIISKKADNPNAPIMKRHVKEPIMVNDCVGIYDNPVGNCRNR